MRFVLNGFNSLPTFDSDGFLKSHLNISNTLYILNHGSSQGIRSKLCKTKLYIKYAKYKNKKLFISQHKTLLDIAAHKSVTAGTV